MLAVNQYPFLFVGLLLEPKQRFLRVTNGNDSSIRGRNPLVRLAWMFSGLVSSGRLVSIGAANVEDCRDLFWILTNQLVCIVLTAEP